MSAPVPATAASVSDRRRARLRRGALAGAALLALVAAVVLGGPPAVGGDLDPRSAEPGGLRGVVDLAEATGGHVDMSPYLPDDGSTRVLVARDLLSGDQRDDLVRWVEAGGTAVVADPGSPVHGMEAAGGGVVDLVGARPRSPDCDVAALAEVSRVTHGSWTGFEVPDDEPAVGCFAGGDQRPWLVVRSRGRGAVVSLGSAGPLVNDALGRDDNAVLAAALLVPREGARLVVLEGDGADASPLGELVPRRVGVALALALLAGVLGVAAVARRLGRPVEERLPPTVPTAELARSLGDLLQRAGHREDAARRLREAARHDAARVLGHGLDAAGLARLASARIGVAAADAERALTDAPVTDDAELTAVAEAVARLRRRLDATS